MHCHCVVIAFYLGGFSHFARVCERMNCEKSFKNINNLPISPINVDARACRQDSSLGIPSCPTVIFLAPVPAIIWRDHEIVQTKEGTFPLQNVLLILT